MEDPVFNDFHVVIGPEKSMFNLNLSFFAMFSKKIREILRQTKAGNL